MTPSTYHKMPVNLQHLCHYDVIKWNISSKYLDIKRKRALNIIFPGFYRSSSCNLFSFLPKETWTLIDSDNRIKPKSDTIFITCMATPVVGVRGEDMMS